MKKPSFDTRPKKLRDHRKFGSTGTRKSSLALKQRIFATTAVGSLIATIAVLDRLVRRNERKKSIAIPFTRERLELRKKKVSVSYPTLRRKKKRGLTFGAR